MKFLKNKAKKALMAAVTMSLVMGVCGSAMAGSWYGQKDNSFKENGYSSSTASDFTGDWDKDQTSDCLIYGGYAHTEEQSSDATNIAKNNTVNIKGGIFKGSTDIYSVYVNSFSDNGVSTSTVENNTVNLLGGTFEKNANVYGASAYVGNGTSTANATARGNTVNIKGGIFKEGTNIYGGYASAMTFTESCTAAITAEGNTVNLLGGTFEKNVNIYGGYTDLKYFGEPKTTTITAANNTVCIGGYVENEVVFADKGIINASRLTVYGGKAGSGKESSGNTVKVMSVGNTIAKLDMATIQNLEFYIPKTAINGDEPMLRIFNNVDFDKTNTIKAGVENGSKLAVGDTVTLLQTDAIFGFESVKQGVLQESDFKEFGLKIDVQGYDKLVATITSRPNNGLKEEAKSPVETQAAGLTMLTTGADMLASQGFDNAASAVASEVSAGASPNVMTPFMAMGGAKTKVKSGSHVDVKGWNLNVGLAKEIKNNAGKLLISPVVEYGKGSYDSYLDNGYHGEGDTDYIGGGVMAKQTNDNGFYYEGSLRMGKLSNDYKANANSYDSDSTYYAAHVGVGKILKLSEKNSLDYYGKYFYTHQKGDDTILHAGGTDYKLHLDSVDSNRTRIGGRFTHDVNDKNSVYAGLAWQHEFSGTARATIDGAGTPAPSVKGNTGIMELGWKVNANKNLDLDLGATGYTGKQKGASLNLALNFKF